MDVCKVRFKKAALNAKIPTRATGEAACYDLYSSENTMLKSSVVTPVDTGLQVALEPGWVMSIRSRSGLAVIGVCVYNAPGTVDSDYRGNVKVLLYNSSFNFHHISVGDRIAQCIFERVHPVEWEELLVLPETSRDAGGFGSTGK